MSRCRCISFDGGGIRGIMQAEIYSRLEESMVLTGFGSIMKKAEVFAGTSVGAVIATCLAFNIPPSKIEEVLRVVSPRIFRPQRKRSIFEGPRAIRHARFTLDPLREVLSEIFAAKTLGDSPKKLLITSFCLKHEEHGVFCYRPVVFHNFDNGKHSKNLSVVDACLRSCAAPGGYFPIYQGHIDGGVWANNPTAAMIAELIRSERRERTEGFGGRLREYLHSFVSRPVHKLDNLRVLSIGSGLNAKFVSASNADWGMIPWIRKGHFFDLMMGDATTASIHYYCESMLGHHYQRIQPLLTDPIDLADIERLKDLRTIGESVDLEPVMAWLRKQW